MGSVKFLLDKTHIAYYWLGFICADGNITNSNRLRIRLAVKDSLHLQQFAKLIGKEISYHTSNGYNQCSVCIMDTQNINKLCKEYDIKSNKTINPITFNSVLGLRNKISFIAGFIDGDGCIDNLHKRKNFRIRIKCHNSWLDILNEFSQIITGKKKAKINKQGYASLSIGDRETLKKLKRIVILLNIPFLKRKWDFINLNYKNETISGEKSRRYR